MFVQLIDAKEPNTPHSPAKSLTGNCASSLHRLNDENGQDGGFFVFGDLAVKIEGIFVLRFTLFERRDGEVTRISAIDSAPFNAVQGKEYSEYANVLEVSALNRAFWNQGVRLRVRSVPKKGTTKSAPKKNGQFHPYKQPRAIKKEPKPSNGSDASRKKIAEQAMPAQGQIPEFGSASSSAPPLAQTTGQMPLQQGGSVPDPQLQQLLNWQELMASNAPQQPHAVGGEEAPQPDGLPALKYPSFEANYGPLPIAQDQIIDQIPVQQGGFAQSDHLRRLSTEQTHYQQPPGYLAQPASQGYIPNPQSGGIQIAATEGRNIQLPPLQLLNSDFIPPEPSADEVQSLVEDLTPAQNRRPRLGELRMYPSGDQNLSAGSMESGVSLSTQNNPTSPEDASGGNF